MIGTYKVEHPSDHLLRVVPPVGLVHLVGLSGNVICLLEHLTTILIHCGLSTLVFVLLLLVVTVIVVPGVVTGVIGVTRVVWIVLTDCGKNNYVFKFCVSSAEIGIDRL